MPQSWPRRACYGTLLATVALIGCRADPTKERCGPRLSLGTDALAQRGAPDSWRIARPRSVAEGRGIAVEKNSDSATQPFSRRWRPIGVPGFWHERLGGSNTGTAVYRLHLVRPGGPPGCHDALHVAEVPSAAEVYWNGVRIGQSGEIGDERGGERALLAPAVFELPAWRDGPNRLDIIVTNHHSRGGGILGVSLGSRWQQRAQLRRTLAGNSLAAGMGLLAGSLFGLLFFVQPGGSANLAAACLLVLLAVRTTTTGAVLEQVWPQLEWTDLRLLLEYLSAMGLGPTAFYCYVRRLLPDLDWARADSPLERLETLWLRALGYVTVAGGATLCAFILWSLHGEVYGRWLGTMLLCYFLPVVLLHAPLLLAAVRRRLPGAGTITAGYAALAAIALWDGTGFLDGDVSELYTPLGVAGFVLFVSLAPIQQMRRLHLELRRAHFGLDHSNAALRAADARRDRFVRSMVDEIGEPLQAANHLAHHLLNTNRHPDVARLLERTQALLQPIERWRLWEQLRSAEPAFGRGADVQGLVRLRALLLQEEEGSSVEVRVRTKHLDLLANRDQLQTWFTEITPYLRGAGRVRVTLRPCGEGVLLLRVAALSRLGFERDLLHDEDRFYLGLHIAGRIAELHGAPLVIRARERPTTEYRSFALRLTTRAAARLRSRARPESIRGTCPARPLL